ncbi:MULTISPECIES: hypothetical protein [unclassified Streptomyces]
MRNDQAAGAGTATFGIPTVLTTVTVFDAFPPAEPRRRRGR